MSRMKTNGGHLQEILCPATLSVVHQLSRYSVPPMLLVNSLAISTKCSLACLRSVLVAFNLAKNGIVKAATARPLGSRTGADKL